MGNVSVAYECDKCHETMVIEYSRETAKLFGNYFPTWKHTTTDNKPVNCDGTIVGTRI